MKTKSFLMAALVISASAAYAQEVEIDDMYFTAKDRAALNAAKPLPTIKSNDEFDAVEVKSTVNPTDSYSGRGTNPDYTAQTVVTSPTSKIDPAYFSSNYQPTAGLGSTYSNTTGLNNLYSYNNNYGNGYNNYGYNGYGNYGMNSFYGSRFNNFYSPFSYGYGIGYSPYYNGYGWGNGFGFGSTFGMGYGNYGYSPYGYGNYGYSSYYPTSVVIINDGNSGYVRGRRGARAGADSYYDVNRSRGSIIGNSSSTSAGGRVSSSNQYYDRSWRNSIPQSAQTETRSYYGNRNYSENRSNGNSRTFWDGSNGQSSFGNSRNSFGNGNSGGNGGASNSGGSSGGSSSGGGGGGRSRH